MSATFTSVDSWWPDDAPPVPPRGMNEHDFEAWVMAHAVRAEFVDGKVVIMTPVGYVHDDLQGWIAALLRVFVEDYDLGKVTGSEYMIRLGSVRRRLPDTAFISLARTHLLKKNFFDGPPDLIVEVVSEDSIDCDWREKFAEYEAAGVQEYWIIDPITDRLEAHQLNAGRYASIPEVAGRVPSHVVSGWYLRKEWLFGEKRPKVSQALGEMESNAR